MGVYPIDLVYVVAHSRAMTTKASKTDKKVRDDLTPKQARFVDEFLVDLNATQAAIRAGYKKHAAFATGHENLRKPKIEAAIAEALKDQQQRTEITADDALKETGYIAFSDIRKLFNENGGLKKPHELDDDIAKAIAGIDVSTVKDGEDLIDVRKIKLWSKNDALEKLGKHFQLFVERKEVTGKGGGPIETETTHVLSPELQELFDEVTGQKDADTPTDD